MVISIFDKPSNAMQPGSITVHLPLKPYLRKYLIKKYGDSYKISSKSLLGIFLIEILDKQYRKDHRQIREKSFYTIEVPKYIVEKVGFDLPTAKMRKFEEMITKLFKTELESHIDISIDAEMYVNINDKKYKLDVMKAMKQFLNFYEITEDDLKLESVYRDYKRNKNENGQRIAS